MLVNGLLNPPTLSLKGKGVGVAHGHADLASTLSYAARLDS